jgi:cytochrome b subunit of formate dehydrogenase
VAVVPDASAEADVVAEVAHKDTDSENGAAWFAIGIIFLLIAIAVTGWVLWLQYVPL